MAAALVDGSASSGKCIAACAGVAGQQVRIMLPGQLEVRVAAPSRLELYGRMRHLKTLATNLALAVALHRV